VKLIFLSHEGNELAIYRTESACPSPTPSTHVIQNDRDAMIVLYGRRNVFAGCNAQVHAASFVAWQQGGFDVSTCCN
jgi:hypothetical protein